MMHQTAADVTVIVQVLPQRIGPEARVCRARRPPADDLARGGVDDEHHVDKACPRRDVVEV